MVIHTACVCSPQGSYGNTLYILRVFALHKVAMVIHTACVCSPVNAGGRLERAVSKSAISSTTSKSISTTRSS